MNGASLSGYENQGDDAPRSPSGEALSHHLRVRVVEAGNTRVELTFKAAAAEYLVDLLPPELEEKLQARGVDVARIAVDAVRGQFAPGDLFELTDGSKQVRVWLE